METTDGTVHAVDRLVWFEKTSGETAEDQRELQELLRTLRIRTLETELAERARQKRERLRLERSLEIQIE